MPTIDFAAIRSAPKSKNDSFEALAVQLFQHFCDVPKQSSFYSLRGDGGDGGVEAFFRTPSGEVLGVQAKYFFSLGSKELSQIAKSLEAARLNHPTLLEYWIYIPFDLTGRVAGGGRGQGEVERFEVWKNEAEARAEAEGKSLRITLCSSSVMREQLQRLDSHGGIRRYWFDDSILTPNHIHQCLEQAREFAGPRYSGDLDVVTDAHNVLDFFGQTVDFADWRHKTLTPLIGELRSLCRRSDKVFDLIALSMKAEAQQLLQRLQDSLSQARANAAPEQALQDSLKILATLHPILKAVKESQEAAFFAKHGADKDTPSFRQFSAEYMCAFPAEAMDAARELCKLCSSLDHLLASPSFNVTSSRSLLLVGPAGVGKTHAIVSAALRRFTAAGMSLVMFGDDFGGGEPWEVIRSKLGLSSQVSRDALFQCMSACAQHTGLPFVIFIDALNESRSDARWIAKLPELIQQCRPFDGVKICVSTRDTYKDLVTDSRFPGYAFEHRGFNGQGVEALQAFAAFYGLDAEITPLFAEELSNPLFLHLACKTLKEEGSSTLDVSLPGFSSLLERHLKHTNSAVKSRLGFASPKNLVRQAMLNLAELLSSPSAADRQWEACATGLRSIVAPEISAEVFIRELEREGLVILTEGEDDNWTVRLGYERYGDVLRASALIDSFTNESSKLDAKKLGACLIALPPEDKGLLEVLAAVLPEKTGVEIVDKRLGLDPEKANHLFVSGLAWRSRKSFEDKDLEAEITAALNFPGLWEDLYEVFIKVSLVPDHRLNAKYWLDWFLARQELVSRDAFLSTAAYWSYDKCGAVKSLLDASLKSDIMRWPRESRHLATIVLGWLTSCADRRVRDHAAKGLVRLLVADTGLTADLARQFAGADDDYIQESIAEAIYSACLIARNSRASFLPALDVLVSRGYDRPNIIIRDSIRMLSELLGEHVVDERLKDRLLRFPSKTSPVSAWPTLLDAKPLLDLKHLPSDMELWGSKVGPDFWRYQVERKVSGFDLKSAGISLENIACWIMTETLRLGYPGFGEIGLDYDRSINSQFGSGRGRAGHAERLGKKYYWISLHRLLAILADHVSPLANYEGTIAGPNHYWSVEVRKRDLTDMRDVIAEPAYPELALRRPQYSFPSHDGDIKKWVKVDDLPDHDIAITRNDASGGDWVALTFNMSANDRSEGDEAWIRPYFGFEVHYSSVFSKKKLKKPTSLTCVDSAFSDTASCYRSYLAEYPNGAAFEQLVEEGATRTQYEGLTRTSVTLDRGSEWEYEYTSESEQISLDNPCQDLVRVLELRWDQHRGWLDCSGVLTAFSTPGYRNNAVFVRKAALDRYLEITKQSLLYRRFMNRGFFDNRGKSGAQIDKFTYLQYVSVSGLVMLHETSESFNC